MAFNKVAPTAINAARNGKSLVNRSLGKLIPGYRKTKSLISSLFETRSKLPYIHVCQIGDPVLRAKNQPVDPALIGSPQFQSIVKHLTSVMRKYGAMGLSAPQVGLPYQVFIMEMTKNHLSKYDEGYRRSHAMELVPLKVFVNPTMKISDWTILKHSEGCLSVCGHTAVVGRNKSVQIEAYDALGITKQVHQFDGWAARIVQHEMDHLQGKMFVDRMDPTTFCCGFWPTINARNGKVRMQYYPLPWWRTFFRI